MDYDEEHYGDYMPPTCDSCGGGLSQEEVYPSSQDQVDSPQYGFVCEHCSGVRIELRITSNGKQILYADVPSLDMLQEEIGRAERHFMPASEIPQFKGTNEKLNNINIFKQ